MNQARATVDAIARTMPHSEDAERAVLACALLKNEIVDECISHMGTSAAEKWGANYFYDLRHQVLWVAMAGMRERPIAIDFVTLRDKLVETKQLEAAGGETYLLELTGGFSTPSSVLHYLDIVKDRYTKRQLIESSWKISAKAFDWDGETDELVDFCDKTLFEVCQQRTSREAVNAKDITKDAMQIIENALDHKGSLRGLASGFPDLDKRTGGFQNGDMIVIGARPSIGKTSFAMNIAEHVAIEQKLPVAMFSLEMTEMSLVMRMMSSVGNVDATKMRDGFITPSEHSKIVEAANKISKATFMIDDDGGQNIFQLRAKARRLKRQYDIKLFVVDYLQLMHGVVRKNDNRVNEVAEISGGLKALAKELKVPFLVICQLNREVEKRDDRRPRLSDIRECGSIEQDADVVLLLTRSLDYENNIGEAECIIAKQRNGPVGTVQLTFLSGSTKFVPRAISRDIDEPPQRTQQRRNYDNEREF